MRSFAILVACLVVIISSLPTHAGKEAIKLHPSMFDDRQSINLSRIDGWLFREGNDPAWSSMDLNNEDWEVLKPVDLENARIFKDRTFEGWFRLRFILDKELDKIPLGWWVGTFAAVSLYIDGELVAQYGNPDPNQEKFKPFNPRNQIVIPHHLEAGREYLLSIHLVHRISHNIIRLSARPMPVAPNIGLAGAEFNKYVQKSITRFSTYFMAWITALSLLSILFWVLYFMNRGEKALIHIAMVNTSLLGMILPTYLIGNFNPHYYEILIIVFGIAGVSSLGFIPMVVSRIILQKLPRPLIYLFYFLLVCGIVYYMLPASFALLPLGLSFGTSMTIIIVGWKKIRASQWIVIAGLIITVCWMIIYILYTSTNQLSYPYLIISAVSLTLPVALLIYVAVRFTEILRDTRKKADEIVKLSELKLAAEMENKKILEDQKQFLEEEVTKRTAELKESLEDLKKTQRQLIHTEKMASLGELTAGIAHEIQNPLNFVNNFSDINSELIEEIEKAIESGNLQDIKELTRQVRENEERISQHGKRAETIVKGMLMHSRSGTGDKEITDINSLADEYLRLAYHGFRARDKSFNATFVKDFDDTIPRIEIVAQDMGRVLLNLISNAFHAVDQRKNNPDVETLHVETLNATSLPTLPKQTTTPASYTPTVTVSTKNRDDRIEITVADNGPGIPVEIREKIFQPFFTTKKGSEGTGLGLSISHDIVRAHGGEIQVDSSPGQTLFIITLPILSE